jgi:hypothetical protein
MLARSYTLPVLHIATDCSSLPDCRILRNRSPDFCCDLLSSKEF